MIAIAIDDNDFLSAVDRDSGTKIRLIKVLKVTNVLPNKPKCLDRNM